MGGDDCSVLNAPQATTAFRAASTVAPVIMMSSTISGVRPCTSPITLCATTSSSLTRTLATMARGRPRARP
jgi:hypothetical protein